MHKKAYYLKEILLIILVLVIFCCTAFIYVAKLKENLESDLKNNLTQIAQMNSDKIKNGFEDNLITLRTLASMLENEDLNEPKKVIKEFQEAVDETIFFRFGIVDKQGMCYTTDGVSFDVNDRSYYHQALAGKSVFTSSLKDKLKGYLLNVFAVPIYQKGHVEGVLFGSIYTNTLSSSLTQDIYNGEGFSAIVDVNGNAIVQPDSKSHLQTITNIKELEFTDHFDISQLKKQCHGVTEFHDPNGDLRYLAFEAMDINDWYVLSIVPEKVVSKQINHFTLMAFVTWVLMALLFALILFYHHYSKQKNSKKMDEVIFHDPITEHYNYNRFRMYMQDIFDLREQEHYSLIELDLCDFKMFNELYSYQDGDTLLKLIMQECENSCHRNELCARISGDRFLLALREQDKNILCDKLKTIIKRCQQQITALHGSFRIRFKCGVYLLNRLDDNLSRCHDHCVYAKNQVDFIEDISITFYSQQMYEASLQDKRLEGEMRRALENGEFQMYLQPKIDLHTKKVYGAEALVRWNSKDFGRITPSRFIQLFEKNGMLQDLDTYMLRAVCLQLQQWQDTEWGDIVISINVSRSYIFRKHFAKHFYEIVKEYGVSPNNIDIEITESVMFNHSEELISILQELKDDGFRISMDDFGSGYSSLNMLKDIPLDIIKLDQVFFRSNQNNWERSKNVVKGVIRMAKDLNLLIIAEGVETYDEYTFLFECGCDAIQGFYFAKPMPRDEFMQFLIEKNHG